jgi:hypothetical protein
MLRALSQMLSANKGPNGLLKDKKTRMPLLQELKEEIDRIAPEQGAKLTAGKINSKVTSLPRAVRIVKIVNGRPNNVYYTTDGIFEFGPVAIRLTNLGEDLLNDEEWEVWKAGGDPFDDFEAIVEESESSDQEQSANAPEDRQDEHEPFEIAKTGQVEIVDSESSSPPQSAAFAQPLPPQEQLRQSKKRPISIVLHHGSRRAGNSPTRSSMGQLVRETIEQSAHDDEESERTAFCSRHGTNRPRLNAPRAQEEASTREQALEKTLLPQTPMAQDTPRTRSRSAAPPGSTGHNDSLQTRLKQLVANPMKLKADIYGFRATMNKISSRIIHTVRDRASDSGHDMSDPLDSTRVPRSLDPLISKLTSRDAHRGLEATSTASSREPVASRSLSALLLELLWWNGHSWRVSCHKKHKICMTPL